MSNNDLYLTTEEQQLLESIEANEWQTEEITDDELQQIKENANYTLSLLEPKSTTLNLRTQDLASLKAKGIELGIDYQGIIQALIHNYLKGEIKLKI